MSWLNLNQSLNSLKGQITNFASEVLAEAPVQESGDVSSTVEPSSKELEEKCRNQELEIAALKRLTNELEATLQSERLSRKNGVKEEESSWYWDPPTQTSKSDHQDYVQQILTLQDEISNLKDSVNADIRPDFEEEVSRLREENKNLTTNLEDLDSQHQMAMEKLLMLKKELQKNFEVLKQEHEDLKNSNDDYSTEIQNLLAKIGQRDEEIKHLKASKTDYDTLHHKYLNLEKVHSVLRENAEKFQEENQELHEEVFKLQEQVTKLEHEIEVATKHTEMSNCVPRERYDELVKELSEVKHRRNSNQLHLDESNIDDNAKGVIETLKRDINELKHKLNQKYDKDYSDHSIIKSEKIMQLYNKYVNFELPVDYIGQMPSSNDNIVLYKLESAFKTLNSFKKNIDTLEHKLSEKNHNINHLQTQIDDLTTENDFLTSDIQHFEGELNEMKKNNDFLISEIAALKNTSKLEPIIETTHEDNLAKLESELADSNKINKTFESEIKRIQSELDEVKTEKTKLQESLHDLRTKYTAMLSEFETCKTETKAVEEFEHNTKNEHYHKIKNLMTDEIDDLKKRLHAANAKNEQLSIDIHIIENDKVLLTKQVDDLKHALEEKSSEHKELESMKKSLDHKLQELENKLDELIKHKQLLEKDKTNLEQKVNVLQSEVSCKSNETQHTAAELEKVTSDKIKLSEKLAEIIKENSTLLETVEKLNNELTNFRQSEKELFTEKSALKNTCQGEAENITLLQQTIEDLKAKMIQQEVLNNEILFLKEENHKILQSKLQLETELSSTDSKIAHLEEEFEKLITDLNEKDNLIDSLNTTITHNNIKLLELNQNVTDLGNSVDIKNLEIQRLTKSLAEVTEKLNDTSTKSDLGFEELKKLHNEKEDLAKQILNLHEEVHIKNIELSKLTRQIEELEKTCTERNAEIKILHSEKEELNKQFIALTKEVTIKNIQISELTNQLEELGKNCADYVATIDNKDKEIKELNQSIVELTDKIKTTDNTTHQNDDYAKLAQEKQSVEQELIEIKSNHTLLETELTETKTKFEQVEKTCLEYKTYLENATREKNELINLVNLKHNESIQYHNEIQRLNHVLLEQTNEFKKIVEDKDRLIQNHSENCMNCEQLRIVIKEKDDIIISLNQNATDYESVKAELLNASETIKNLTERCENLDKSLAIQLEAVKKLTAENVQLSEQEQNSTKELERLRHHLVEMEENYTQELMTSEQKLTECQTRLHQVEQRAKQTSTVYTSNSIRANQEVETLRNQIKLLEKQREEVQTKLSEAEDARSRSEAALTNLQVVLEQFQLDKERDIHSATEKIRNKMEDLKRENRRLHDEIAKLNAKLEESLAGLEAATRLGDQVETKTAQINDLKEQVRTLETSVSAAEERYYNAISNQQDKVDKNLVKNLVINYVLTAAQNNLNKTQVLRILSTVLDFNQQECEKLGLVRSSTAPDSLAAEFVKFLQDESRPRATLPNMMGLAHNSSRSSTPTSRKSSTLGPQPNPFDTGHKRNPSTGSNNLLFQNLDHLETTSQVSIESETKEPRVVGLDTGVNQTRSSESAILKYVLKDM